MPGPKPPAVVLSVAQRRDLERLVSARKTGQALVRRARVVLLAAMGYTNTTIAEQIPMDVEGDGLWRRRWVAFDAIPRPKPASRNGWPMRHGPARSRA